MGHGRARRARSRFWARREAAGTLESVTDEARLAHLKAHPDETDQGGHGCCGPAGVLMGLLVNKPKVADELFAATVQGGQFRGVENSGAVKGRIQKRLDAGLLEGTTTNSLDMRLSIGLMILLKEHLKQQRYAEVWEGCSKYSEGFAGWSYGSKVKDEPDTQRLGFSYKHGDLALTISALACLLKMVTFGPVGTEVLISNTDLVSKNASAAWATAMRSDGAYATALRGAVNMVRTDFAGALIGVTKQAFAQMPAQEPYQHVAHWVYLPKPAAPCTDSNVWDTEVWTWGARYTLKNLADQNGYAPKVAVYFS